MASDSLLSEVRAMLYTCGVFRTNGYKAMFRKEHTI